MKRKLTLSIDDKIINLARLDNINISGLLETYLSKYLETNGLEEIETKISHTKMELEALIDRKKDLLKMGLTETKDEQVVSKMMDEFKKLYKKRRLGHGDSKEMDVSWINSPNNLQRCKLLHREPLEVLMELRESYDVAGKR